MAGFLVPATKAEECLNWKDSDPDRAGDILARGTKVFLANSYRQVLPSRSNGDHPRPVIWKPLHRMSLFAMDAGAKTVTHVFISNNTRGKARPITLCKAHEDFSLTGPGAEAHIEEDANAIATRAAEKDSKARKEAREKAEKIERISYGNRLKAAFEAMGFDVNFDSGYGPFSNKPSIGLSLSDAARIIEALGGDIARPDDAEMPLWQISYNGEDFTFIGGRTEAAARSYVLKTYRTSAEDGEEGKLLDPRKLAVRPAPSPVPFPETPEVEEDAA
jgi:hypothetical protein